MAAVFTFTTVVLVRHTQILSRWLTIAGRVTGLVQTVTASILPWIELLFPSMDLDAEPRNPHPAPQRARRVPMSAKKPGQDG